MACSSPNMMAFTGYEYKYLGARRQELHVRDQLADQYYSIFDIPCGKCDLCRINRRYDRALRIMLEAEFWPEKTYFITLTFSDEHLGDGNLDHNEWAQFMKAFRQKFCQAQHCPIKIKDGKVHPKIRKGKIVIKSETFKKIKQVVAGEYGDTFGRKHFHGIIFNHGFHDIKPTGTYSKKGNPLHTSAELASVWNKGFVEIEEITFDLALYVGSYITDMGDGDNPNEGYKTKQYGRLGHFIGLSWLKKYWPDVLSAGKIMLRERDYPIPRYFMKKMEEICPAELDKFKKERSSKALYDKIENIKKGDGPLRRAQAKGRIFEHIHSKKERDSGYRQAKSKY